MAQRDGEHLLGGGHLEVERPGQLALEPGDVVIGDVAAVLAQVGGDAVGARLDGEVRGAQRIGMAAAARVADGGDVVDVDAKAQMRRITESGSVVVMDRASIAVVSRANSLDRATLLEVPRVPAPAC